MVTDSVLQGVRIPTDPSIPSKQMKAAILSKTVTVYYQDGIDDINYADFVEPSKSSR